MKALKFAACLPFIAVAAVVVAVGITLVAYAAIGEVIWNALDAKERTP